uniref:Uncharacterized protein n=1 Tax=Anguilla anguilla TaxID=7936 RepID=A0A0E9SNZ6_ANGAN
MPSLASVRWPTFILFIATIVFVVLSLAL